VNLHRLACRALLVAIPITSAATMWAVSGPAPWAIVPGSFLICALICCAGITNELANDADQRARELRDGPPLDHAETAAFDQITRHFDHGTAA
jgi:hypothetical protein